MDKKAKEEILKNIEKLRSASTSGDIAKIEQETIQIIRKSSEANGNKPTRENE